MPALIWLLLLSALEGSSWFLPVSQVSPAMVSGLGAASAWVSWLICHPLRAHEVADEQLRSSRWLPWVAAGALGLPATLIALAQPLVGGTTGATLLAGVPFVTVCTLHLSTSLGSDLGEDLLPVLAGLGGTLLLLPFYLPASRAEWVGVSLDLAATICAGVFGVWAYRLARTLSAVDSYSQIAVGNAVVFSIGAVLLVSTHAGNPQGSQPLTAVGWMVVIVVGFCVQGLSFWMLNRLDPVSFASRFFMVPLVVAAESWLFWRPTMTLRQVSGAALMLASVGIAVRKKNDLPTTILPKTRG